MLFQRSKRLVGIGRLDASPVRMKPPSTLATAMRASLLSSTTRTLKAMKPQPKSERENPEAQLRKPSA